MLIKKRKPQLNEDLNIMPVLDILSTLVVFLLLTAVWYQVGSFKTESGFGSSSSQSKKEIKPIVIGTFLDSETLVVEIKDLKKTKKSSQDSANIAVEIRKMIQLKEDPKESVELLTYLNEIKRSYPDIMDSIVIPNKKSPYEKVIFVMDQLNKSGIKNIGLGYGGI
jgi:biopolymer transport protein TolR